MGFKIKIRKLLLQTVIAGISIILVSFASVMDVACLEIKDWVIVDKAWLDKNLGGNDKDITSQGAEDPSNPAVLFIEVAPDSEYTGWNGIESKWSKYKGYASEHIGKKKGNKILWEAIHTKWPSDVDRDTSEWGPGIQPNHFPDFILDTMKSSAEVACLTTGNKWCTKKSSGMIGLLDPITAADKFLQKFPVSHNAPSAKNNDIHIVIYMERLPHDYVWASLLYWLFDFYGYPSEKLHMLNGGLEKWKNDGGPVVSGKGPAINPADYRFIPELKPEVLADKTLTRAVTKGVIKGIVLDVRGDPDTKDPLEPGGITGWSSSPNWWDPMQGYHIAGNVYFPWDDSLEKNAEGRCIDYKGECVWKYGLDPGLQKTFEAKSIGKDDLILLY